MPLLIGLNCISNSCYFFTYALEVRIKLKSCKLYPLSTYQHIFLDLVCNKPHLGVCCEEEEKKNKNVKVKVAIFIFNKKQNLVINTVYNVYQIFRENQTKMLI